MFAMAWKNLKGRWMRADQSRMNPGRELFVAIETFQVDTSIPRNHKSIGNMARANVRANI
jgi:hypothetical protein